MIVRYLLAALVAGLFSGVLMTAAQEARVVPLILHAEEFEGGDEAAPESGTASLAARDRDGLWSLSGGPMNVIHDHGVRRGRKFDQVLEGAHKIFMRDGFERASVDDIRRLIVNPGSGAPVAGRPRISR